MTVNTNEFHTHISGWYLLSLLLKSYNAALRVILMLEYDTFLGTERKVTRENIGQYICERRSYRLFATLRSYFHQTDA
jgi:hypothetical protein